MEIPDDITPRVEELLAELPSLDELKGLWHRPAANLRLPSPAASDVSDINLDGFTTPGRSSLATDSQQELSNSQSRKDCPPTPQTPMIPSIDASIDDLPSDEGIPIIEMYGGNWAENSAQREDYQGKGKLPNAGDDMEVKDFESDQDFVRNLTMQDLKRAGVPDELLQYADAKGWTVSDLCSLRAKARGTKLS